MPRFIPKEWDKWTSLEQATYWAQIATIAASLLTLGVLFATVVFSYLTLKEARQAREDQAAAYYAEKAPHLEIQKVGWGGLDQVEVTFKNTGVSLAKNIQLRCAIDVQTLFTDSVFLPKDPTPFSLFSGETKKSSCSLSEKDLGFSFTSVMVNPDRNLVYRDGRPALLQYSYDDVSDKRQGDFIRILVSRSAPAEDKK